MQFYFSIINKLVYYFIIALQFKMRSFNERKPHQQSSSESSFGDDDRNNKVTTNFAKMTHIVKPKNQQNKYNKQSDQSSLSEEDSSQQQKQMPRGNLKPKLISSDSESQSQNSIDHIEERIKKLEQDLEHRIDRHKKQSETKLPSNNRIQFQKQQKLIKNVASPPLPKKVQVKPTFFKQETPQFQTIPPNPPKQNYSKQSNRKPEDKNHDKMPVEQVPQKNTQKISSPKKNKQLKKLPTEQKYQPQKKKPQKPENKNNNLQSSITFGHMNKANKQIQDLMMLVQQLKSQNKQLKEELKGKKKKPFAQLQKLKQVKQLTGGTDAKLQKELQLLKIIESLQTKLKKSINKKIGKARIGSSSSALLHKGMPTTALN